jgi:hypothetical protein
MILTSRIAIDTLHPPFSGAGETTWGAAGGQVAVAILLWHS